MFIIQTLFYFNINDVPFSYFSILGFFFYICLIVEINTWIYKVKHKQMKLQIVNPCWYYINALHWSTSATDLW